MVVLSFYLFVGFPLPNKLVRNMLKFPAFLRDFVCLFDLPYSFRFRFAVFLTRRISPDEIEVFWSECSIVPVHDVAF